jgi:hypothetical protein
MLDATPQLTDYIEIVGSWKSPDGHLPPTRWTFTVNGSPLTGFEVAQPIFDLKVALVRRNSRINPDNETPLYAWYEVLVLIRPQHQVWMTVAEARWFFDKKQETNDKTLSVSAPITEFEKRSYNPPLLRNSLSVSDATEGRWTQFVPNAEKLARSASIPLNTVQLQIDRNDPKALLISNNKQALSWMGTDAAAIYRGAGKEDQGLFNLLLLTKKVASLSGQDEEAYVGIYHSDTDSKNTAAIKLTNIETSGGSDLTGLDLVGRILTIRVGNPNKIDFRQVKLDPWQHFFPKEDLRYEAPPDGSQVFGSQRATDAPLQIIEIYAPIVMSG